MPDFAEGGLQTALFFCLLPLEDPWLFNHPGSPHWYSCDVHCPSAVRLLCEPGGAHDIPERRIGNNSEVRRRDVADVRPQRPRDGEPRGVAHFDVQRRGSNACLGRSLDTDWSSYVYSTMICPGGDGVSDDCVVGGSIASRRGPRRGACVSWASCVSEGLNTVTL